MSEARRALAAAALAIAIVPALGTASLAIAPAPAAAGDPGSAHGPRARLALAETAAAEDPGRLWTRASETLGRFVATGLSAGLTGPYTPADLKNLTDLARAFRETLAALERTGPPAGQEALYRELLPVHRDITETMGKIVAAARAGSEDDLMLGWEKLQLLADEAATLGALVAGAPARERPNLALALGIFALAALLGVTSILMLARRRRAQPAAAAPRFCGSCGAELGEPMNFCPYCGTAAAAAPPAARSVAPGIVAAALALVSAAGGAYVLTGPGRGSPDPTPTATPSEATTTPTQEPTEEPTRGPTQEPTGSPDSLVRYRVINVRSELNIRAEPRVGATEVGSAHNGDVLTGPGRSVTAGGWVWVAVYRPDSEDLGWAAMRSTSGGRVYLKEIGAGGE